MSNKVFSGKYYNSVDFTIQAVKNIVMPAPFIYSLGWVYGYAAYWLSFIIYYKLIQLLYGLERLTALDEFFLLDNAKNRANVISVCKVDKVPDCEALKKKVTELAIAKPRLRHRLRKVFGEYFFERMNDHDLKKAI